MEAALDAAAEADALAEAADDFFLARFAGFEAAPSARRFLGFAAASAGGIVAFGARGDSPRCLEWLGTEEKPSQWVQRLVRTPYRASGHLRGAIDPVKGSNRSLDREA